MCAYLTMQKRNMSLFTKNSNFVTQFSSLLSFPKISGLRPHHLPPTLVSIKAIPVWGDGHNPSGDLLQNWCRDCLAGEVKDSTLDCEDEGNSNTSTGTQPCRRAKEVFAERIFHFSEK